MSQTNHSRYASVPAVLFALIYVSATSYALTIDYASINALVYTPACALGNAHGNAPAYASFYAFATDYAFSINYASESASALTLTETSKFEIIVLD